MSDKGITKHITATPEMRAYLANADPILGALIEKYGVIDYELHAGYLSALLSNIVGQQLSNRVADVIWSRFLALLDGPLTAEKVLAADDEKLRGAGMSYSKAAYLKNICRAVTEGRLQLDRFDEMPDEAVIAQLTAIKGIGAWTAEMFLIFSLGRADIFSKGDGGLSRAINNLYAGGAELSVKERLAITEAWKPFCSIASLYLWRSLDNQ
ncbi:MAG: DNA-3-methyladenine glycosylase 2 family protein [Firmicutes bacterium]|nr:DNA-3-methyladenine glycosylase 2 family protein [Bacillota bacterium]